MNRALRAATMGVLLLSPAALSACSAGQITQTAGQERDKVGAMVEVGQINLRAVELAHPSGGAYDGGDDAELRMAIVNEGQEDDALVEISGEGFGEVEIDDGTTPTAGGTGNGSRGASEIEIPAGDVAYVDGEDLTVTLTGLDGALTPGQSLELTFTFENAGEVTVTVPVSAAEEEIAREQGFDFHHKEGGGSSEEQREGEQREGGE